MKSLFLEVAAVVAVGMLLAFAANGLSPAGLHDLSRNYLGSSTVDADAGTNSLSAPDQLRNRFAQEGLQLADSNQVIRLFHDPGYSQGQIVFIDARNEREYREAHIPGAYELDYYHPDNDLAQILNLCQAAQQIVVYCHGGDCEDSEHEALLLRDAGIPKDKLWVYGGGVTEWASNGLPQETGARDSGTLLKADK